MNTEAQKPGGESYAGLFGDEGRAVRQAVKSLLFRTAYRIDLGEIVPINNGSETAAQALKNGIQLGGGFTLMPHVGKWWAVDYEPGPKITLWDKNYVKSTWEGRAVLKIAAEIWAERPHPGRQLSIFQ